MWERVTKGALTRTALGENIRVIKPFNFAQLNWRRGGLIKIWYFSSEMWSIFNQVLRDQVINSIGD